MHSGEQAEYQLFSDACKLPECTNPASRPHIHHGNIQRIPSNQIHDGYRTRMRN